MLFLRKPQKTRKEPETSAKSFLFHVNMVLGCGIKETQVWKNMGFVGEKRERERERTFGLVLTILITIKKKKNLCDFKANSVN